MIRVTEDIILDDKEIQEDFVRAGGPGGQHVNKASTAVQIRFDAANSPSLPDDVRERLFQLAGKRVTDEGILVIQARRFREQHRNREDAINRLTDLIRKASEAPAPRRKTRAPASTDKKRLEEKRRHGKRKKQRKPVTNSNYEDA